MARSIDSLTPGQNLAQPEALQALVDQIHRCEECRREGNDLLLKGADGQWVRLDAAWDVLAQAQAVAGLDASLQSLLAQLRFEGFWVQVAQVGNALPEAAAAGPDTELIARLAPASEPAQVVRGGQTVTLQPGDGLLPGDVLQTSGSGQARLELLSAQGAVVGQVTAGANSKLSVARQGGDNPLLSVKVDSGALLVDKLNESIMPVRLDTPAGAGHGRGVSGHVAGSLHGHQ